VAAKVWGEPVREDRSFYVHLNIPRENVSATLTTLQRGCKRVSDFGYGVLAAPKDCWVEVLHYCGDAAEFLQHLTRLGIPREAVRECREVVSGSGHLMSRQPSLF
jgi:hypothetical protein